MADQLDLDLVHEGDTALQTSLNSILTSVVNTSELPSTAAVEIDNIITISSQQALQKYTTTRLPSDAPSPRADQNTLWDSISRAVTAIPPTHPGQAKLVSLIAELRKLPKKTVKAYSPDDYLCDFELWTLTRENRYAGLEQMLWELDQGEFHGDAVVEEEGRGREFVNFSAFLARLLSAGVVETARMCGLRWMKRPKEGMRRGAEVQARADGMWLIYAAEVLFECSRVDALTSVGEWKVTRGLWERWKEYYGIMVDEKSHFGEDVRNVAREVVAKMREVEKKGVATHAIQTFGFDPQRDDEDEEDEDE